MHNLWLKLVVVAAVLAIGLFVYFNIEIKESIVDIGPTSEVYRKHFLAAEMYLEPKGVEVQESSIPPSSEDFSLSDVVVVTNQRAITSPEMADDLYQWVKSGGHLIWSLDGYDEDANFLSQITLVEGVDWEGEDGRGYDKPSDDFDFLSEVIAEDDERSVSEQLEDYNTELREQVADDSDEDSVDAVAELTPSQQVVRDIRSYEEEIALDYLALLSHDEFAEDLFFVQNCCRLLDHPLINPDSNARVLDGQRLLASAESTHGYELIQLGVDRGKMTVLLTTDIWHNHDIGYFDHARLLLELAGDANKIIFHSNPEWPSIWQLLKEWTPEVLIACALLLIFMLIKLSSRFGPILDQDTSVRRSLLEHIFAMADFHWRHNHADYLLSPFRMAVISRMRILHADFDELRRPQQFDAIAERSGVPRDDVKKAFYQQHLSSDEKTMTDWQFHESVLLLERIRKQL